MKLSRTPLFIALGLILAAPAFGQELGSSTEDSLGQKVIFLVDASGSMTIGGRFKAAKAKVVELVQGLDRRARFDIVYFHHQTRSRFKGSTMTAKASMKKRLAKLIAEDKAEPGGFTDFAAALKAALKRRPDSVVLLSDGIATRGAKKRDAALMELGLIIKRAKLATTPRLTTIAVQSGDYAPDPRCENKSEARRFFETLALRQGGLASVLDDGEPGLQAFSAHTPSLGFLLDDRGDCPVIDLGLLPVNCTLRPTVTDLALARGVHAITEYGARQLQVISRDDAGKVLKRLDITLVAKGVQLRGDAPLAIHPGGAMKRSDEAVVLPTSAGGTIELVYSRNGEVFRRRMTVFASTLNRRIGLATGGQTTTGRGPRGVLPKGPATLGRPPIGRPPTGRPPVGRPPRTPPPSCPPPPPPPSCPRAPRRG